MSTHSSMLDETPDPQPAESTPQSRPRGQDSPSDDLDLRSCGLAIEGLPATVYNEPAFRYFLEIERKRAEQSNQAFLLLLIDLKKRAEDDVTFDGATSQRLFSALALCVRETDFIGWYREGRIAGAVLTQDVETPGVDVPDTVRQRITRALGQSVPRRLSRRLQVRVYQAPSGTKEQS